MVKPLIVFGSGRERGNTWRAIQLVVRDRTVPIISLASLKFSTFDYGYNNSGDDFTGLATAMTEHDPIILATPIYWYTMSAQMKAFLDRCNDFTTHAKDIGRRLRGRTLGIITSYSTHPDGKEGFEPIFVKTADYLGLTYGGCFFHYSGEDAACLAANTKTAEAFAGRMFGST